METLEIEDIEKSVKVIVVGNGSVGKSSLIRRFAHGSFDEEYKQTLGTAYHEKRYFCARRNEEILFHLWDTAGQEKFDSLTRRYYRGAAACILVFSCTDRESFRAIERWNRKVQEECGHITTVLIENKLDLLEQAVIGSDESEDLARRLRVKFFRICVRNNFGVDRVFAEIAEGYFRYMESKGIQPLLDICDDLEEEVLISDVTPEDLPVIIQENPEQSQETEVTDEVPSPSRFVQYVSTRSEEDEYEVERSRVRGCSSEFRGYHNHTILPPRRRRYKIALVVESFVVTMKRTVNKTYRNGDRYEGETVDGKKEGFGTYFFHDGRKYAGEWEKGKRNGMGRLYYATGELQFRGDFRMNRKHGHGVFHFKDGRRYEGDWANNKPNGTGKQINADDSINFEGRFRDGRIVQSGFSRFVKRVKRLGAQIKTRLTPDQDAGRPKNVVISGPRGFNRAGHIGFEPGQGFQYDQIPAEWKQFLIDECEFSMDELGDASLAEGLVSVLTDFDGLTELMAPPPEPGERPKRAPASASSDASSDSTPDSASSPTSASSSSSSSPSRSVPAAPSGDSSASQRTDVFAQIRSGEFKLKHIDEEERKQFNLKKLDVGQKKDLMSLLKAEMARRKDAMSATADEIGDTDGGDEWEDDDTEWTY